MTKIIVAGDYCPRHRISQLVENKEYNKIFGEVKTIVENSDYSVVNLECPVVSESNNISIKKIGPILKTTNNGIEALKFSGFNLLTLANNHFLDYGEIGVNDTLNSAKKFDLEYVGGGRNLMEAQKIHYKKINSRTFAFINFCENEFSIATHSTGGSNPMDLVNNFYQIQEAQKKSDFVIVVIHGGHEYYQYPSPKMKKTYRFFIDAGADVIINHHQHCMNGYEIYKGKPIFYGIGNFCFDWENKRDSLWNEGYLVELLFNNDTISFNLIPYIQGNKDPGVIPIKDQSNFLNNIEKLNSIISNNDELSKHFKYFVFEKSTYNKLIFEPYKSKISKAFYLRKFLPSFLTKKSLLNILNHIECESHFDITINMLKNEINKK